MENKNQAQPGQWNAEDYAKNSSAQALWANELIAKLELKGFESLLDIGCGDGKITAEIARRLPSGRVVGIDFSESMIALASKSFTRDNLSFYTMNATAICLEQTFDIAFSNATLHWVEDHPAVLSSLRKHLNPHARILFQMGGYGNAAEIARTVEQLMAFSRWAEYFVDFKPRYHFYTVADYERWLPAAGYAAQRIELIPKDMVHRTPDELKGWLRTTWFPHTDRLPENQRETFLSEWVNAYLSAHPLDANGQTHVQMIRLEVEANVI